MALQTGISHSGIELDLAKEHIKEAAHDGALWPSLLLTGAEPVPTAVNSAAL